MSGKRDPDELIDDLESIKHLLSEDENADRIASGDVGGDADADADAVDPGENAVDLRPPADPPETAPAGFEADADQPNLSAADDDSSDAANYATDADSDEVEYRSNEIDLEPDMATDFDDSDSTDNSEKVIEDQAAPLIPDQQDLQVPVLDDVVDGALEVDEGPLVQRIELDPDGPRLLREDTIQALMGDDWKHSADAILSEARESILAAKDRWSPQQTDELVEALKVRIDTTVDRWLATLIVSKFDELSDLLGTTLRQATTEFIAKELGEDDGE